METVHEPSEGDGWQYEPNSGGFRCIAYREGGRVHLQTKRQKSFERYFPYVGRAVLDLADDRFVFDGEIVITDGSFETLRLGHIQPKSASQSCRRRRRRSYITFDLLARNGEALLDRPLGERRVGLESWIFLAPRQT